MAAIRCVEQVLRHSSGVHEFTDDPECVFRIALRAAKRPLTLGDRTLVRHGDTIAELHLWNEQLPQIPRCGAGIAWGATTERRVRRSFSLLAAYLAVHHDIVAVRGEAAFGCQMERHQSLRLARRFGFEFIESDTTRLRRLHHACEDVLIWGLTWAFNPFGLAGKAFQRERYCLWASRAGFSRRWDRGPSPDSDRPTPAANHNSPFTWTRRPVRSRSF